VLNGEAKALRIEAEDVFRVAPEPPGVEISV